MAVKGWAFSVRARHLESNFCIFQFEPQAERLIFSCIMTQVIANLSVLAEKLHYVTFGVITRNITRLSKTRISRWFIRVFDEPGFLLIRRSLVRAQVEEPPKKTSSKAMFFPFIRNNLSRWGPLGDFLTSNFIELLHIYYTADGSSQVGFVTV